MLFSIRMIDVYLGHHRMDSLEKIIFSNSVQRCFFWPEISCTQGNSQAREESAKFNIVKATRWS
jgi:hypothetical protein